MTVEVPIRPARAAVGHAADLLEEGAAKAGDTLAAVSRQVGELRVDDEVRQAAARLAGEADELLKELDDPATRERISIIGAIVLLAIVAGVSFLVVRQRRAAAEAKRRRSKKKVGNRS